MAILLPRTFTMSSSLSSRMSSPSRMILPPTISPGGMGTNRIRDSTVTDFPEPDSPTIPMVSPRFREKETPSTAFTVPNLVRK